MFDAQTTALLRTVLDEVCDGISRYETGVRAHVASQILEAARRGEFTIDELRQAGSKALSGAPTMWR
jgi:urease gamma subunit